MIFQGGCFLQPPFLLFRLTTLFQNNKKDGCNIAGLFSVKKKVADRLQDDFFLQGVMRTVSHKTKLPCIVTIQGSLVLVAQKYNRGEICFALTLEKFLPQSSGLENAVNCRTPLAFKIP